MIIMTKEKDIHFLRKAFESARDLSQDANSQTGAVLVSSSEELISHGANRMHYGAEGRFEYGMNPKSKILLHRPKKYLGLVHAEKDAIFSAARLNDFKLISESTLYATWALCITCATTVINMGIERVVTHQSTTDWYNEKRTQNSRLNWDKSIQEAIALLKERKIKYEVIKEPLGGVTFLFDDEMRTI